MRAARLWGRGRRRNCGGFLGGGQGADDVEIGAAEENRVGAEVGGLDAELLPAGEDEVVDFAGGGQGGVALEGRRESVGGGERDGERGQD